MWETLGIEDRDPLSSVTKHVSELNSTRRRWCFGGMVSDRGDHGAANPKNQVNVRERWGQASQEAWVGSGFLNLVKGSN